MDSLGAPWKIDGLFDAETTVEISTADDWTIGEFAPITEEWTPEEIARVYAMHAAPELKAVLVEAGDCLEALGIRKGLVGGLLMSRIDAAIAKATPPDFTSASTTRDRQEGK